MERDRKSERKMDFNEWTCMIRRTVNLESAGEASRLEIQGRVHVLQF